MDELSRNDLKRQSTRLMPIETVTLSNLIINFWTGATKGLDEINNYADKIQDSLISNEYKEFVKIFSDNNLNEKQKEYYYNMLDIFNELQDYNIDYAHVAHHFISTHYLYYPTWFYKRTKVYGKQTQTEKYFFNLFEKKSTVDVVIDEPLRFIYTMMQEHPELFIKKPSQSGFINENDL